MKYYDKQGGIHKSFLGAKWGNVKIRGEEMWRETEQATVDRVMTICEGDYHIIMGDRTSPDYQMNAIKAFVNIIITTSDLTRDMPAERRKEVFMRITNMFGILGGSYGSN